MNIRQEIEIAAGVAVSDISPLGGGCIGQVYRVSLVDGSTMVAKIDERERPCLDVEGYMRRFLREQSDLPVPEVLYCSLSLLLMSFLPGESVFGKRAQQHAADLLAALHQVGAPAFGLERDTLIGGMYQPNPWTDSWLTFFRDQRLLFMAHEGVQSGRLPESIYRRLDRFCAQLDRWLQEPAHPSLIHGDVWTTNVVAVGDKITGFVDPAIYFADPEIELAFTTLFGTFGEPFFARYKEIRPLEPGFFEERRDIYNLYPLLVHVRLFGGSYVSSVENILRRFGF